MPLAPSLERVVLAKRMGGELFGHHQPTEVRMAREADPEQIPDLPLQPVGGLPELYDALDRRLRIVDEHSDCEPAVGRRGGEQIRQTVAVTGARGHLHGRVAIFQIVDAGDIDQEVEALCLEKGEHLEGQ